MPDNKIEMRRVYMNRAQIEALLRKWKQSPNGMTFLQFRRSAHLGFGGDCFMVQWCGMWLGIEKDGYTHS